MTLLLIIGAAVLSSELFATLVSATNRAPEGHEDRGGFHYRSDSVYRKRTAGPGHRYLRSRGGRNGRIPTP